MKLYKSKSICRNIFFFFTPLSYRTTCPCCCCNNFSKMAYAADLQYLFAISKFSYRINQCRSSRIQMLMGQVHTNSTKHEQFFDLVFNWETNKKIKRSRKTRTNFSTIYNLYVVYKFTKGRRYCTHKSLILSFAIYFMFSPKNEMHAHRISQMDSFSINCPPDTYVVSISASRDNYKCLI